MSKRESSSSSKKTGLASTSSSSSRRGTTSNDAFSRAIANAAELSDNALLELSVKDLNILLKSLPPDERLKLKKRRRILKNRGYAANCRTRRMSQKEILELEKETLESDVKNLRYNNQMMKIKLDSIKERFKDLQHYATVLKSKQQ